MLDLKKAETKENNYKWLNRCTSDTTINLHFAIYCLVLSDSVVGVKKSFCIQTYLQNSI